MSDQSAWSVRRPMTLGLAALAILVGGFGVWGATTNISGAVVATGKIEVDRNRQVVQHQDGGVVAEVVVKEGDEVEAGQLLMRLDATDLRSELAIVENQLFEILARRGRLEAEQNEADAIEFDEILDPENAEVAELMEGQRNLFEARNQNQVQQIDQLTKRRDQIANQVDGIASQQEALKTQLGFIEEELVNQESLFERGLAAAGPVLALKRERANLLGRVGELEASQAEAAERSTEIDIQILGIKTVRREEAITQLRDIGFRELELREQQRNLTSRLERLYVRAPVGGIVYGMQVFGDGAVIRPADPVAYIVPQDRPLVIASQVEVIHVDQVYVGQQVLLRFSAFDQRRTPELYGQVSQVSADAFTDEQTGASYYRAEIVLSEDQQSLLPEDMRLVPGMPVEAFLRTDDRTPLAYLTKPLADYFAKAFRES